jgi:hypothetical protein
MLRLAPLLVCAAGLWAAQPTPPAAQQPADPLIDRAASELEKVRTLVEAGALPRQRLVKAQSDLDDARDAALLRRTLYGPDLSEDEADGMVETARRRVERRATAVTEAERLVEAGVMSRLSLTEPLEALDRAKGELDAAEARARLVQQIADMAHVEIEAVEAPFLSTPAGYYGEKFDGKGEISASEVMRLESAFLGHFSHPLPVSARGQTAVHRALGFDHRDRVDVAVHPDTPEGIWLRRYLETNRIPYFAFRMTVPGKSTAPHIHIGPQSGPIAKGG